MTRLPWDETWKPTRLRVDLLHSLQECFATKWFLPNFPKLAVALSSACVKDEVGVRLVPHPTERSDVRETPGLCIGHSSVDLLENDPVAAQRNFAPPSKEYFQVKSSRLLPNAPLFLLTHCRQSPISDRWSSSDMSAEWGWPHVHTVFQRLAYWWLCRGKLPKLQRKTSDLWNNFEQTAQCMCQLSATSELLS